MFNVKISLLYFLLIALSVVVIHVIVGAKKEDATLQAEGMMERVPAMVAVHTEAREQQMLAFARRLADSEIRFHVQTLQEFREDFIDVDKYICAEDTGVKCDLPIRYDERRAQIAEEAFGETTFASFSAKLTGYVKRFHPEWSADDAGKFTQDTRKRLLHCFGRASKRCDWRFTYDALLQVFGMAKDDLESQGREDQVPDVVQIYDAQGVGLASATMADWSDEKGHVSLVERLKQYVDSRQLHRVMPVYYDLLELGGESEHIIAMVPMLSDEGKFLGAVLVGHSITGKMVEAERKIFDKEVTYILDDNALATTMSAGAFKFLLASVPVSQRLKKHLVKNEDWIAVSIPYYAYSSRSPQPEGPAAPTFVSGAAYGAEYQRLRVVLAVPRCGFVGSYCDIQLLVPAFGLLLFLLGLILIFILIRNHTKPFERIDAGIHEVINGNFDYQFPFDYKEDLPSSMAQSLNLMTAVLLGKPLPEDEAEASAGWGEGAMGGPAPRARARTEPEGELIVRQAAAQGPPPAGLMDEPPDAYYKRLYGEYRRARTDAGEPDDAITYVRFVEQLVKSERELKSRLGARNVRFVVTKDGDRIVLEPYTS